MSLATARFPDPIALVPVFRCYFHIFEVASNKRDFCHAVKPVLSHVLIAVVCAPATFPLRTSGVACVKSRAETRAITWEISQ
ncbi:hypothetical protein AFLA_003502 [Aspergillus flavus NRRL3357]|nr:hypothetical protein AFLA_003502 [Aspergillus flavus NRRL3357]